MNANNFKNAFCAGVYWVVHADKDTHKAYNNNPTRV